MNKKIVVYVIVILVVIIVAFYFFSLPKNNGQVQMPNYGTPTNQPQMPGDNGTPVNQPAQMPTVLPPASVPVTSTTTTTTTTVVAPTVIPAKTYNVSVINFSFNPQVLTINKGDTVVWTNQDSVPHQVWGDAFKGPVMSNGQNYSFVFNGAGTFAYHCNIHPSMTGTIVVK